MTLKEAKKFLAKNLTMQVKEEDVAIPFLVSPPGTGKTATCRSMAEELGWKFLSTQLGAKLIEELTGIPRFKPIKTPNLVEKEATSWSVSELLALLYETSAQGNVLWLLDDIHLAGPSMIPILYELLTARLVKDNPIPKNVGMVLAGNDSKKAHARDLSSAVMNRIFKIKIEPSFQEWKEFAVMAGVNPSIIAFLQSKPNFFFEEEQISRPWCSPRSWTRLSKMMDSFSSLKEPLFLELVEGHVGPDAASEFTSFYRIYSKYDFEKLIEKKENIPTDMTEVFSLTFGLANFLATKDKTTIKKAKPIISNIMHSYPDLGVAFLKELILLEKIQKKPVASWVLRELHDDPNLKKIVNEVMKTEN